MDLYPVRLFLGLVYLWQTNVITLCGPTVKWFYAILGCLNNGGLQWGKNSRDSALEHWWAVAEAVLVRMLLVRSSRKIDCRKLKSEKNVWKPL